MAQKEFYTVVNKIGNYILYRGYSATGKPITKKVKFSPTLFVPSPCGEYRSLIDKEPLAPITLDNMNDAYQFINENNNHKSIHGVASNISQYITKKFPPEDGEIYYDQSLIDIMTIDIEVISDKGFPFPEVAEHPIVLITTKSNRDNKFHIFGCKEFDNKSPEDTVYYRCENEIELLKKFISHWSYSYPDIVTGWNSKFFDIPYILNRIKNILDDKSFKKMSPFGICKKKNVKVGTFGGQIKEAYEILGVAQLDYLDVFKKFGYSFGPQEQYTLDHIASVVLGKSKISYAEYTSLANLYHENFQLFAEYNKVDVDLVDKMEDKISLISLVVDIAYKAGTNYADTFGTTAVWESIVYRKLIQQKIIMPPKKDSPQTKFLGAYVKEPQKGLHGWGASFDLNSLYPNIMIQYNMSPETLMGVSDGVDIDTCIDNTENNKLCIDTHTVTSSAMASNGAHFRTDRIGVLPEILTEYYRERKIAKNKMIEASKEYEKSRHGDIIDDDSDAQVDIQRRIATYTNKQMTLKILLNSVYGAFGNRFFLLYDLNIAKAITYSGQFIIKSAEIVANKIANKMMGNKGDDQQKDYIIAMDTDSLYVNFDPIVKKYMSDNSKEFITKKLSKIGDDVFGVAFNKKYKEIYSQYGGMTHRMEMEREVIFDKAVWIAKKKYFMNVLNNEGIQYDQPKLKIIGVEAVRSSTPSCCRDELKSIFKAIMDTTEDACQDKIERFREKFFGFDVHDIAFPRGVNGINKYSMKTYPYYKKGCPINVRAAITYNRIISDKGLIEQSPIISGDKIKFIYLTLPNPTRENIIAFPQYLDPKLCIDKFIDTQTQFDKAYIAPLKKIFDTIGWSIKKTEKMDQFFI